MKLAGEFEYLGDAYRGDPEFEAPPPKGVVKLFYLGRDEPGGEGEDAAATKVRLRPLLSVDAAPTAQSTVPRGAATTEVVPLGAPGLEHKMPCSIIRN